MKKFNIGYLGQGELIGIDSLFNDSISLYDVKTTQTSILYKANRDEFFS